MNKAHAPLSTTSAEVITNYNRLLEEVQQGDASHRLQSLREHQWQVCLDLLQTSHSCPVPMLRDHLGELQADRLKEYLTTQFQNPEVMQATMCLADTLFYTSPYDLGSLYQNQRIRLYLSNLTQVSQDSNGDRTLTADFGGGKGLFKVKVTAAPDDRSLPHEMVVGLYGTNRLRQHIPNFSYVYGGFRCSPPIVDPETQEVVTWCHGGDNPVNYLLVENVEPAVPMADYLRTCSGPQFLDIYLQVLYALRFAQGALDFTHYDLNYNNVVVRQPGTGLFQIRYPTERGEEYLLTDSVATIVDYKFAHIKVDRTRQVTTEEDITFTHEERESGHRLKETVHERVSVPRTQRSVEDLGVHGYIPLSIFPHRSWIMADLYKFLMFCLMGAYQYNNEAVLREAIKLFRFFNRHEDPLSAVETQYQSRFAFPYTKDTAHLSADQLAVYIRHICDCSMLGPHRKEYPILDCEQVCLTQGEVFSRAGMKLGEAPRAPTDLTAFYDLVTRLQNQGRDSERDLLRSEFPYPTAMRAHLQKMGDLTKDLWHLRSQIKLVDLTSMDLSHLLQYTTMRIVRSMYVTVAAIADKTEDLRLAKEVGLNVAGMYNDERAMAEVERLWLRFVKEVEPALMEAKLLLRANDQHLDQLKGRHHHEKKIEWLWNGRDIFQEVLWGKDKQ